MGRGGGASPLGFLCLSYDLCVCGGVGVGRWLTCFFLPSSCSCVSESHLLSGEFWSLICLILNIGGVGNVDKREA